MPSLNAKLGFSPREIWRIRYYFSSKRTSEAY